MTDPELARLYLGKVQSSKDRGIEFSLSFAAYKRLRNTRRCAYTGLELTDDNFSIDRIDASVGYVDGNVVACDKTFNSRKSSITRDDIRAIMKLMARRRLL